MLRRASIFFIGVFLLSVQLKSQTDSVKTKQKGAYFGLLLGGSVPLGDFSYGGLAKIGFNAEVSIQFPLAKNFGVCSMYKYLSHPVRSESILSTPTNTNYQVINSATPWKIHTALGGIYTFFALGPDRDESKTLSVDIRAAAGICYVSSPDISLVVTYMGHTSASEIHTDNALQFSYLFSAGFRKKFGENAFKIGVDYFGSRASFQNVSITSGSGSAVTQPVTQKISILLLNAGYCVSF